MNTSNKNTQACPSGQSAAGSAFTFTYTDDHNVVGGMFFGGVRGFVHKDSQGEERLELMAAEFNTSQSPYLTLRLRGLGTEVVAEGNLPVKGGSVCPPGWVWGPWTEKEREIFSRAVEKAGLKLKPPGFWARVLMLG